MSEYCELLQIQIWTFYKVRTSKKTGIKGSLSQKLKYFCHIRHHSDYKRTVMKGLEEQAGIGQHEGGQRTLKTPWAGKFMRYSELGVTNEGMRFFLVGLGKSDIL